MNKVVLIENEFTIGKMAPFNPPSPDIELLQRMLKGDEGAFVTLYRRWQGGIYRFALQMSGSQIMAEDVTQEVFLCLMREPARFDVSRGALSSYLYGISRNLVLQAFLKGRPLEPTESGHLIRMNLPRSTMGRFGFPINSERGEEPIKADVLIGEDGVARAIRFIYTAEEVPSSAR